MFKKIISAVIALTLVVSMCSCSEQQAPSDPSPNPLAAPSDPTGTQEQTSDNVIMPTANYTFTKASGEQQNDEAFLSGINSFSVELFKSSVKDDLASGKNTLISPESVAFALGMTANGANGETLEQMRQVLCSGVDMDTFNKNMNLLISNSKGNKQSDAKLNIANSVWVKDVKDMTLTDQFAKNCKELYDAELVRAPFDSSTVDSINSWVNDKTDKMIPQVISDLDPDTRAVLINCIAFDAKWAKPYEEEQIHDDEYFTSAQGKTTKCTMLYGSERQYVSDDKAQGFIKNYKGGKYAFMAILPNEGVSISDYVFSLSADSFSKLYAGSSREYTVYTRMPKFTYDYDLTLNKALIGMGMGKAFSDSADFSGMTNDTQLHIGLVYHKTHIELDAQGTKAAAATVVTMDTNAAVMADEVKEVFLDRPFVYAIMDTQTGLPVFMGTVCDPSAQ